MKKINSKDVLMSIKPQYAIPILNGTKTIELRRRFPTDLPVETRFVIYASSPVSKVIGECKLVKVEKLSIPELWDHSCTDAMISYEAFTEYFHGCEFGYAIHLYKQVRYDAPKHLDQVLEPKSRPPQSYMYLNIEASL